MKDTYHRCWEVITPYRRGGGVGSIQPVVHDDYYYQQRRNNIQDLSSNSEANDSELLDNSKKCVFSTTYILITLTYFDF